MDDQILAAGGGVEVSPSSEAGEVTQTLLEGDGVRYKAVAADGWSFVKWTITGVSGESADITENPTPPLTASQISGVKAIFSQDKQDWTGTKIVEGSALYGETGTVSILGYLPTDTNVEIPEESVSVSDPDGVLDSWSFNNIDGIVTYTFVNDPSKSGKQATISATVKSDKYNDYTGSVVLTVLGKVPATYKITVTDDGNGTATSSVTEAEADAKVQLTATPKDRSYVFDKWVSEEVTVEDDAFEMPAKAVTVKATFKKASTSTYAITFDANGGTGSMDKLSADEGATVALTANAFKRSGYTFAGWNTAKDGSGTAYADKASVTVEGDMTLYAQWKAASSSSSKTAKTVKTGDTLPVLPIIATLLIAVGALAFVRARLGRRSH